jgi:hypothetical protein
MAERLRFRKGPVDHPYGRWRMNEQVSFLADEALRAGDHVTHRRLTDWVAAQRALTQTSQAVPERPSSGGKRRPRPE